MAQELCQVCVLSLLVFNISFATVNFVALEHPSEDVDILANHVHLQE